MSDRRLTPANGRVAHISLEGRVTAGRFVSGEPARVAAPIADLLARPGGPRDRQVLMGEGMLVLERHDGFAFVRADKDGYCGYLPEAVLGSARQATHWVSAPATHLYRAPDIKTTEVAALSLGARLSVTEECAAFLETAEGLFVPRQHVHRLGEWSDDVAGVAESLLGTPYLWGGNSRAGIDCSGLVQAALTACGIACPGDSDLQETELGVPVTSHAGYRRGDLLFWKGHVAMAVSAMRMVHANAWQMAVGYEDIDAGIARIAGQGGGPVTSVRRL